MPHWPLTFLILNLLAVVQSYILDAFIRWISGSQSTPIRIDGDVRQTIRAGIGHLEEACGVMDLRQAQASMEANDPCIPCIFANH